MGFLQYIFWLIVSFFFSGYHNVTCLHDHPDFSAFYAWLCREPVGDEKIYRDIVLGALFLFGIGLYLFIGWKTNTLPWNKRRKKKNKR